MNYLPESKDCRKCGESKPLTDFYVSKVGKYGRLSICTVCERKRVNDWIASKGKKEKRRRKMYAVMYKYGLSENDYNEKLIEQSHKCALCGVDEIDCVYGTLYVDHDHSTGNVRSLLCKTCNTGLGNFKDNPELLTRAADYLKEHSIG